MDDADGGKAEAGKLAVLFAEHAPRLRRLLRGMLVDPARVEDALQATFVKALEKQAEREKDYATLAEVLERRADATSDNAQKLAVLQKLGSVYSDRLKDTASTTK